MYFQDRVDAGKQLAWLLGPYKNQDVVVYGLPRGGVVVAAEISWALHAPLELVFAHKISHPSSPEYAIGAVSESGHLVGLTDELHAAWAVQEQKHQLEEIKRKRVLYLKGKKDLLVKGKIAILVDDGVATGLTMLAGIEELKGRHPEKIVVAVPVSPRDTAERLKGRVEDFIAA